MARDDRDDDRSSRRGRGDEDDRRGSRRGRDDDERGASRRSSRDDDDRGSTRRSSRDDDDERSGGSSRGAFEYRERTREQMRDRAESGDFDRMLKSGVKAWKPNSGDNRIRILPPTWKDAQHYGVDAWVHYGVGADRQSYLCLAKNQNKPDPIAEACEAFQREMDPDNKKDQEYHRQLKATKRVLVYLIDRDHENEGIQAWFMPKGFDTDIVKCSVDKVTGEVLPIDHPEKGYDITFEKNGQGQHTKYEAVSIARRSTPLGKSKWLDDAMDAPLPDQLMFFSYDHIAKAFGAGPAAGKDTDDRAGRSSRDDDRKPARDDDRGGGRDDKQRGRNDDPDLTWETIHDMTGRELKDLVEDKRLDINPREAKDDDDLADWICDELKISKAREPSRDAGRDRSSSRDERASTDRGRSRDDDDDRDTRRRGRDDDDDKDADDRLGQMRERRRARD